MTSDAGERPTMACHGCNPAVPEGEFCGYCGCNCGSIPGKGPKWLRLKEFSAAPGERVLTPNIASTLFPHLPPQSRKVFLLGLALLLAALVAATLLRLPAVLITVAALGLPLLFLLYLQEADIFRDIPSATLITTSVVGMGLGIGWVLLTGAAAARSYGVPLGAAIAGSQVLRDGLAIPIGSLILSLVPVVIARLRTTGARESLDGFALGALGALMFCGAATMTRLAPKFALGMVDKSQPMRGLMVEAVIRGITVPLTAACVGALVGTALWFSRPEHKRHEHRTQLVLLLGLLGVVALTIYIAIGLVDIARTSQLLQMAGHLLVAAVALLVLRVAMQLALLHEGHDEPHQDEAMLCVQCGHVVADLPFCAACGMAARASSRSSRTFRREHRPTPSQR